MKFRLQTVNSFYDEEDKQKLETLGFKFEHYSKEEHKKIGGVYYPYYKIDSSASIDINTIEELIQFQDTWGNLIVSGDCVTIFDGYL